MKPDNHTMTRRRFLKTSTQVTALAGLSVATQAYGANSDRIRVGLVGCGGRGTGAAAQALTADEGVVLTAMGDAFDNRVQNSRKNLERNEQFAQRVKVPEDACFVGLDAYQKVIDSDVDVVLLATPPGFRPQHLRAAIEAGKHVFCEKPMATDAPGVRSVLESAAVA
ncbi:MAG: Gfo/Idh/MocA family protein, partial [Planctomycetota bacterium]